MNWIQRSSTRKFATFDQGEPSFYHVTLVTQPFD
jgi:hypothetical protein